MLKVEKLFFSYNGKMPFVLDNINLNVENGDYLSVIGENGCGKSTLIKVILGLLKPLSGSVFCETKTIGYVPQKINSLNSQFPITVDEILKCHLKATKINDKNKVQEYLNLVGMGEYKNNLIGNLSGGQMQKIFVARALIGEPNILILDEPSTGIDAQSQKEIYKILRDLNNERGITVISIEHNAKAVKENSKHIYEMKNGVGELFDASKYYMLNV